VILVLVGPLTPRVLAHDGDTTASPEGSTGQAADVGAAPSGDGLAALAAGGSTAAGDLAAEEDATQLPMPLAADPSPADRPQVQRAGAATKAGEQQNQEPEQPELVGRELPAGSPDGCRDGPCSQGPPVQDGPLVATAGGGSAGRGQPVDLEEIAYLQSRIDLHKWILEAPPPAMGASVSYEQALGDYAYERYQAANELMRVIKNLESLEARGITGADSARRVAELKFAAQAAIRQAFPSWDFGREPRVVEGLPPRPPSLSDPQQMAAVAQPLPPVAGYGQGEGLHVAAAPGFEVAGAQVAGAPGFAQRDTAVGGAPGFHGSDQDHRVPPQVATVGVASAWTALAATAGVAGLGVAGYAAWRLLRLPLAGLCGPAAPGCVAALALAP